MLLAAVAGSIAGSSGGADPSFTLSGTLSTTSASSPVTSSTRTVTGSGTAKFSSVLGNFEYSKNGGAWTLVTEGLTLALVNPDTLAVRFSSATPASGFFDLLDNSNSALVEAVTMTKT